MYKCDYCDRTFPDNERNRRKHAQGLAHRKNVYSYYSKIDKTGEFLQNLPLQPCPWFAKGYCRNGDACKLLHEKHDKSSSEKESQPISMVDIRSDEQHLHEWFQKRLPILKKASEQPNQSLPPSLNLIFKTEISKSQSYWG